MSGSSRSRSIPKTHGCASTLRDSADAGNGQRRAAARHTACQSMPMTGVADRGCRLRTTGMRRAPRGSARCKEPLAHRPRSCCRFQPTFARGPQRRLDAFAMMDESIFISTKLSGGQRSSDLDGGGKALLHKSAGSRDFPFPGQPHPSASVTGMPSAV